MHDATLMYCRSMYTYMILHAFAIDLGDITRGNVCMSTITSFTRYGTDTYIPLSDIPQIDGKRVWYHIIYIIIIYYT